MLCAGINQKCVWKGSFEVVCGEGIPEVRTRDSIPATVGEKGQEVTEQGRKTQVAPWGRNRCRYEHPKKQKRGEL